MIRLTAHDVTVELDLPEGDHITRVIHENKDWYERKMLDDIYARKPQGIALDIGACFGTHSAWFSKVCGLDVIAFEPNARVRNYLERNAPEATIMAVAVGNRPGYVEMGEPFVPDNLGSTKARLMPRLGTSGVPMITIDSLGLSNVGLIKIDVEGMELRVLQGAEKTIRECHPLIYVESSAKTYSQVRRMLGLIGYYPDGVFNRSSPTHCFTTVKRQDRPPRSLAVPERIVPATLSTVIMAHPRRERHIPYLLDKMGEVPIVWDRHSDRWDTGRRAMLAYDRTKTHHLVVQDDALLPNDFLPAVEQAIQTVPHNPISFYVGKSRPNVDHVQYMVERAKASNARWFAMEGPWWGVAIVIPTYFIERMIEWADKRVKIANYDKRLSRFFYQENVLCYYSVPSLVSHRTGPENPSLVPGRGSSNQRVAFEFLGEDASALDIEWSDHVIKAGPGAPRKVTP